MGLPLGDHDDIQHIQGGQHHAWEKRTRVKLDNRHTCRSAVNNEHHRRWNQNTQTTTGCNGTCRQLNAITCSQHGRQGQQTHQGDHGTHNACRCGKNGARNDGGHSQRTRNTRSGQVHALEQFFNQVGTFNEVTHEHKQRD